MPNQAPAADLNLGYEWAVENYRRSVLQPTSDLLHPTLQHAYQRCVDQIWDFLRPVVASDIALAKPIVLSVCRAANNAWATGYHDLGPPRVPAAEPRVSRARDAFIGKGALSINLLTHSIHDPDINLAIEEGFVQHAQFIMATIGAGPAYRDEVRGILNGMSAMAQEAMASLAIELGPRPGPGWKENGGRQLVRIPHHEAAVRYWVKRLANGGNGMVLTEALTVAQILQAGMS